MDTILVYLKEINNYIPFVYMAVGALLFICFLILIIRLAKLFSEIKKKTSTLNTINSRVDGLQESVGIIQDNVHREQVKINKLQDNIRTVNLIKSKVFSFIKK